MTSWNNVKKLLEDPEYFLTFEEFTEPLPNGFVETSAKKIREPTDVFNIVPQLKKEQVSLRFIWNVKFMERNKVVGGCTEYALITAALLRKAGFPTAIMDALSIKDLYQSRESWTVYAPHAMHTVNLVFYKGSWWLLDSANYQFTKYITLPLLLKGYMPLIIHRGYSDIGVVTRRDKFELLFSLAKKVFPFDLEREVLYPELLKYLHDHGSQP